MIVVILARTIDEGRSHARLAGLADRDVVIPGSAAGIAGLKLDASDLIVELPGFRGRRGAQAIEDALLVAVLRGPADARPVWHRVGQ